MRSIVFVLLFVLRRPIARISGRGFNRKAVQAALRSIQYAVGNFKQIPPNGLVIFASDTELEMHEPPLPLTKFIYLCDSIFHREILEEMIRTSLVCLLMVVSGNGFGAYLVDSNNKISEILIEYSIELPNSHSKGGQSSVRFDRLTDEARHNYVRKICEWMNSNKQKLPIILAGPASIKHDIIKSSILHTDLQKDIVTAITIQREMLNGAHEALPSCSEIVKDLSEKRDREQLEQFYTSLNENPDLWVFGKDISKALDLYLIEYLLVSSNHELSEHEIARVLTSQGEAAEQFNRDFGGIVGKLYYPIDLESLKEE